MTCQGSVSASFPRMLLMVGCLALLNLVAGEQFIVGGDAGWTKPSDSNGLNYTEWAAKYTYNVGDSLLFKYDDGNHNVVALTSGAAMDACDFSSDNTLKTFDATGNTAVNLTTAGNKWYACSKGNHCASGQKFKITVVDKGAPASSSAPAAAPTFPASLASPSTVGAAFVLYSLATTLFL